MTLRPANPEELRPGQFVVFADTYDGTRFRIREVGKVTAALVMFAGTGYPRRLARGSVLAAFDAREDAEALVQKLNGVAGEYMRRVRSALEAYEGGVRQVLREVVDG